MRKFFSSYKAFIAGLLIGAAALVMVACNADNQHKTTTNVVEKNGLVSLQKVMQNAPKLLSLQKKFQAQSATLQKQAQSLFMQLQHEKSALD
ncbi:MAG: hypothetical protein JKY13_00480, partial [Gammaproteobacteria bacterium]|nr:hypothetical protein [Gammaproteobacteria bacterium]